MNQRIKELSKQAGLNLIHDNFMTASQEKFAELIVMECANIAYNKQYKHSPAHITGDCAQAIREHFGVGK